MSARERFRRMEGAKVVRTVRVGSLVFVLKGIGVMVVWSLGVGLAWVGRGFVLRNFLEETGFGRGKWGEGTD